MRIRHMRKRVTFAILALMFFAAGALVGAEEKIDNPIPKAFKKIKEIGRSEMGGKVAAYRISKAARNTASTVKKAVKGEKSTDSKPAE